MDLSAEGLFNLAYEGKDAPEKRLVLNGELPDIEYTSLDISKFTVVNPAGHEVKNCTVWFPKRFSGHLKPLLTFEVIGSTENCHFFFFRVPDKRSRIKFSLFGHDHSSVIFSNRRMNIYGRMSNHSGHLTIGEAVFIGGGIMALDNVTFTIGASGLWSDAILVQGTDSHGIVDLDTMTIINGGAKRITLGRRVWVGRQAKLMKDITIGEGSIVATGAIVTKDVPPACAVGGVPAKIVKRRVSWTHKQSFISEWDKRELTRLRDELDAAEENDPIQLLNRS